MAAILDLSAKTKLWI